MVGLSALEAQRVRVLSARASSSFGTDAPSRASMAVMTATGGHWPSHPPLGNTATASRPMRVRAGHDEPTPTRSSPGSTPRWERGCRPFVHFGVGDHGDVPRERLHRPLARIAGAARGELAGPHRRRTGRAPLENQSSPRLGSRTSVRVDRWRDHRPRPSMDRGPSRALLHPINPRHGLTDRDFAILDRWLRPADRPCRRWLNLPTAPTPCVPHCGPPSARTLPSTTQTTGPSCRLPTRSLRHRHILTSPPPCAAATACAPTTSGNLRTQRRPLPGHRPGEPATLRRGQGHALPDSRSTHRAGHTCHRPQPVQRGSV
ncbi:hypothetical protein SAMN04487981_13557 [Streptomyces sp. cf386]|nr:hypothetical protein SAMN04487981_13557 [Streptomyces sp. cf386]